MKRFKVDNRRTRILTPDEQRRIIEVAPRKLRTLIAMALITGARAGELLGLKWEHVSGADLTFLHTKNGKARRIPCPTRAVLAALPRQHAYVWTNNRTETRYTVNGAARVFRRAVDPPSADQAWVLQRTNAGAQGPVAGGDAEIARNDRGDGDPVERVIGRRCLRRSPRRHSGPL